MYNVTLPLRTFSFPFSCDFFSSNRFFKWVYAVTVSLSACILPLTLPILFFHLQLRFPYQPAQLPLRFSLSYRFHTFYSFTPVIFTVFYKNVFLSLSFWTGRHGSRTEPGPNGRVTLSVQKWKIYCIYDQGFKMKRLMYIHRVFLNETFLYINICSKY